ncbi:MAG: UDP-N-acetyl-D-glucosamine dehydrogenase [Candidatus Saccharibacteria bacterium]|nr:UDP-N-acetyl-D-glucosamine dehydrogenase [Candidatus Saccharibacteria bacterium]
MGPVISVAKKRISEYDFLKLNRKPSLIKKNVGIIGLGYVGLPLAVQAAEKGHQVTGIELSDSLISKVNLRESPFANDVRFGRALSKIHPQSLIATSNFSEIAKLDIVVICVPTPTTNNIPDLTYILSAAEKIADNLKPGQLIILESTVNPGVTRNNILPILEKKSGLKVGKDFYLAHCPERIDPGNKLWFVGNLNRVVGGISEECTARAVQFYSEIIDAKIIPLGSTEEAEFVKSWENSHRNVLIALANQAAIISDSMGMDINNILHGLQSKVDQFGLRLASPGIGPGGHCIPEDIHYVIRKARENGLDTRFLDGSADLNDSMYGYAVNEFEKLVVSDGNKLSNMTVGLLGLAYKENIEDARRSPALQVAEKLSLKSKRLILHDPLVDNVISNKIKLAKREEDLFTVLKKSNAIFVATAHSEYLELLTPENLVKFNVKYIYDGRNCLDKHGIIAAGVIYKGVGR